MTLAAPSPFRAGKPRPRHSASRRGRSILKVSAAGLAIVVAGCVVSVAAMTGAGWMVLASPGVRADFRPTVRATPLDQQALAPQQAWARHRGEQRVLLAEIILPPPTPPRFVLPVIDPVGALALMVPDASDDNIVTAS